MSGGLEVEGVTRCFGERVAVRALSFDIAPGERVGLLGRNGAGKTTTLRLIAGALLPDAGRVRVGGVDLHADPAGAKRKLAWLAEDAPAHDDMRVEPYLRYRGRLRGLRGAELSKSVDRELERCGLRAERRTLVGHLSRGYRQRVGLADALLAEPLVLLLDEPTSGLDPTQVRSLRELLLTLDGCALLLSSHALGEVQALCRRALVLREGSLIADDTPDALVHAQLRTPFVVEAAGDASLLTVLRAALDAHAPDAALRSLVDSPPLARVLVTPGSAGDLRAVCARAVVASGLALQHLAPAGSALEDALAALWREGPPP